MSGEFNHSYDGRKTIQFSHRYNKMPHGIYTGDSVVLLEVLNSRFQDLHPAFIRYDATTDKGELYPLPKTGSCLVLIFLFKGDIFTTVRRHTPEKEKYYKGLRGELLQLEIMGNDI